MARTLLEISNMDFVFNCASCHGPLIARQSLHGKRVECAHCSGRIEAQGDPVTEAVVSKILDTAVNPSLHRVLRRVKPAVRFASGTVSLKANLSKAARISYKR
jgi:DNA-directed RNA polymerase subunit RPC12/RpoP